MGSILGRLQHVDLRAAWPHEALDFTSWLASSDGLAELQEVIGLDLQVEAQEQSVGPFRADLLCKDVNSDQWVLIENQLEQTDHTHLGQLLTYAAGLEAATIVWIAKKFTDEHRAALDWLNQITDERFRFFGIEIELWRIGESALAPNFNLVSSPNDWSKAVTQSKRLVSSEIGKSEKELFREYWTEFETKIRSRDQGVRRLTPKTRNWLDLEFAMVQNIHIVPGFDLGTHKMDTIFRIVATLGRLQVQRVEDCAEQYAKLSKDRQSIERELGVGLNWDGYKAFKRGSYEYYQIQHSQPDCDFQDRARWPEYIDWHVDMTLRFKNCFGPRLAAVVNNVSVDELMFTIDDEEDDG